MHASLHQLLKLREEPGGGGPLAGHVAACAQCRAELERLRALTTELRALPAQWTPPDRWAAIGAAARGARAAEARAGRGVSQHPGWKWSLATAAAVVMSVIFISWRGDDGRELGPTAAEPMVAPPQIAAGAADTPAAHPLAAEARELEQLLAAFPAEPAVLRASTALTLAELHDRILWVDYRLAHRAEAGLAPEQSELLWRERVDLLNSLVAVRYAQARTSF